MEANQLRRVFREFFASRGHLSLPSASLVPSDPTLLFTIAGMVPFKPWFLGDEAPAAPRVTTVQKCMRAGGKHNDLDAIGTTSRHLTFFEMLGNFSFGDYFKAEAIPFSWELVTGSLGLDAERIWVTVHETDSEAEGVWREAAGVPGARVQRMGEDNWWQMAETGPCGPCSELFFDKGPAYGAGGGPAGGSEERYVELWNLVFMQHNRLVDGTLADLPKRCIDTGAGLERLLTVLQGTDSVFDTDLLRPVVEAAARRAGSRYGRDAEIDVALRILADHSRSAAFLIADGVLPSNEGRGYVLRRIIRRAVRRGQQLDVHGLITPGLVEEVAEVMGEAYPELAGAAGFVAEIVGREEERFLATLRAGSAMLEEELASGAPQLSGAVAFRLHDTFGFPVELTTEIAAERGVEVDTAGFEAEMARQRAQSRGADGGPAPARAGEYREILEQFGPTTFTGYERTEGTARVLAVLPGREGAGPGEAGVSEVEVFLDSTPFYAEGGGQVGDVGELVAPGARALVLDSTAPLPGLIRHRAVLELGALRPGAQVQAKIDAPRREAVKRNHTGTHLLHWALREVLGPHVRQQGSLVAGDRLRFDFSHHGAPTPEELGRVEDLVNRSVLEDSPVRTEVESRAEAEASGAIAFFGERYGEKVRVVHAGEASVELCGGTHVGALGMIGPLRIVSEGSIGANTRRVEAVTGHVALERSREESRIVERAGAMLQAPASEVLARIEDVRADQRRAREELRALRQQALREEAVRMAGAAVAGHVVARRDGLSREEMRELAVALREQPGLLAGVLVGSPDGKGVALVAVVAPSSGLHAAELLVDAARLTGGGGGRDPELAVAGGRHVERIDDALELVRQRLADPRAT
ncbi:MAG: alanine--tRNA ligase [Acidimicrobiales bacterium]